MKVTKVKIAANKKNSLRGGVKTKKGKEISKLNATKHGLSSNVYDRKLENQINSEYQVEGTLEKMLVRNLCISKARYERGVQLENELIENIVHPPRYVKTYYSEREHKKYLEKNEYHRKFLQNDPISPSEPDHILTQVGGYTFEYNKESINYLISTIAKYNYQNEIILNKNIKLLLEISKK